MCASQAAQLDATVQMADEASIMMRADAESEKTGYMCKMSAKRGHGVELSRDGTNPNNCVRRDFSNGEPTRWDPNAAKRADLDNQCFIRDRAHSKYAENSEYKMRMTIEENIDSTVTVKCFVDEMQGSGYELQAWYMDPCPLTNGQYGLAVSRKAASFSITSFTDVACDDVPAVAVETPSLADGLTLTGMGQTSQFWKSTGDNSVTHYYSGACNSAGGKNREAGAGVYGQSASYRARGDALNIASLAPATCVKDGFIEADVTLIADYLNGPAGQYGSGSRGNVGLLMRVESDSDGSGHSMGVNYDSWGYLFQVDMTNGKIGIYRGNNGDSHNRNSIASSYLTGRYKCSNCVCDSFVDCTQFTQPQIGSTHNLRMELDTTENDRTHVKAYLNGTLVADVIDQEHHRHGWWKGQPSAETNMCGDFGLATYDSDVVSYKIKDYTGYVAPPPVEEKESIDVEMTITGETVETFTEVKQLALRDQIALELGLAPADVIITVGSKPNPISRRLMAATDLVITVTIRIKPEKASEEIEKFESTTFTDNIAAATGITTVFSAFKPAQGSAICATCKWINHRIVVTHYINAQEHGEKGLKHKCYHNGSECKCVCANDISAIPYKNGEAKVGRLDESN
jgi:hypothetical protein